MLRDDGTGPAGRWRVDDYVELMARDKASLDIFWLKDYPSVGPGRAILTQK